MQPAIPNLTKEKIQQDTLNARNELDAWPTSKLKCYLAAWRKDWPAGQQTDTIARFLLAELRKRSDRKMQLWTCIAAVVAAVAAVITLLHEFAHRHN